MDDIENAVDSIWDQEIDLDEWDSNTDRQLATIDDKVKSLVRAKTSTTARLQEIFDSVYGTARSLFGADTLDSMLTAALNSNADLKTKFTGRDDTVLIFKNGDLYTVTLPHDQDQGPDDDSSSAEEIDGYTIGTIKDSADTE